MQAHTMQVSDGILECIHKLQSQISIDLGIGTIYKDNKKPPYDGQLFPNNFHHLFLRANQTLYFSIYIRFQIPILLYHTWDYWSPISTYILQSDCQ